MSYTKQTWQAGDEITSAKLNHLEDGINNVATEVANFPVEVNNPQDGDILIYNAAEQKWVSGSNSGGSSGEILKVNFDIQSEVLDKTWKEIYDALKAGYYVTAVAEITPNENVSQLYIFDANKLNDKYYVDGCGIGINEIMNIRFFTDSENDYPVMQHQSL